MDPASGFFVTRLPRVAGRRLRRTRRIEEADRNVARKSGKVEVGRRDRGAQTLRCRADQEIDRRASDAGGSALVEVLRGSHVIGSHDDLVGKSTEIVTKALELASVRDPGKNLLPDQPEEDDSAVTDQVLPGSDETVLFGIPTGRSAA